MPRSLNITFGDRDDLSLPRIDWEGGPDYWTVAQNGSRMTRAEAAGWSDPSFFPIAIWLSDPNDAMSLADVGINTYFGIFHNAGAIATAGAAGMHVIAQGNEWTQAEIAAEAGSGSSVVGWLPYDEPDLSLAFALFMARCATIRAYADGRFLFDNFCHGIRRTIYYWETTAGGTSTQMKDAVAAVDGASADQYCYTSPGIRGDPGPQGICDNANYPTLHNGTSYLWPGDYQDSAKVEQAAAYGWQMRALRSLYTEQGLQRPCWIAVETQMPYLTDTGRDIIRYAEIRGAVWSSLVNEGRGILYFQHNGFYGADDLGPGNPEEDYTANSGNDPNTGLSPNLNGMSLAGGDPALISYVAELNAEITELAPVLNTQSWDWDFGADGIETMLKSYEGHAYIFATKSVLGTTGSKTFTLPPAFSSATTAAVLNESRSVAVTAGQFVDVWANEYDQHNYRIVIS